jgi:hypothetical protein
MPGGYGRGHRHRWWYRATGMPGWMRYGYDPTYDPRYDPREYDYPPEEIPPMSPPPMGYPPYLPMRQPRWSPEDELRMLEEEEQMLGEELEEIKKRLGELRKEVK